MSSEEGFTPKRQIIKCSVDREKVVKFLFISIYKMIYVATYQSVEPGYDYKTVKQSTSEAHGPLFPKLK